MLLTEKFKDLLEAKNFAPLSESNTLMMAQLLENMEQNESKMLAEGTLSADISQFTPILMPLVRRVYPNLIANEIAGVQALNMPTGYLYAMTSRYTGTTDNKVTPNDKGQILNLSDVTGITVGETLTATSGAVGVVKYIEDSFVLVAVTGQLFVATDVIGTVHVVSTFSNESGFQKVLKGYTGPLATATAEALGTNMPEIGFEITRAMAEAKSRKLKGRYTLEMLTDLKSQHGLDAEAELMGLMSMELQLELDREIIAKANSLATVTPDAVIAGYSGRWEIEKYRGLGIKISAESREVGRLTRKSAANTILVSPKVATALEAIGSFTLAPTKGSAIDSTMSGVTPNIGIFDGRYKVITDNFATSDYVNVLYKGASNRDSGMFFAPYTPASFLKTVDPTNGQPSIILSSRYDIVANPMNPETYFRSFSCNFGSTILA